MAEAPPNQPPGGCKRGNSRPFIQITRGAPLPYDYEDHPSPSFESGKIESSTIVDQHGETLLSA